MNSKKKTIGIISGGQLGRMLAEEAIKLGFDVVVLDPKPNCPAAQVGAEQMLGSWKNSKKIKKILDKSDFFTIEIEHLDTDALQHTKSNCINPKPSTIKLIQNKLDQKIFLKENGFPVVPFKKVDSLEEAKKAREEFGGECLLKTRLDAYDGRGNRYIYSDDTLEKSYRKFSKRLLFMEKFIKFKKELAVIAVKDLKGNIVSYPAVETVHTRNICTEVYFPARVDKEISDEAKKIAESLVAKLDGAGAYGVEFFLDKKNNLIVNEVAPRVHNSGHYTMDAFETSQFEQHIRAITGMKLNPLKIKNPVVVMINILGERVGPVDLKGYDKAMEIPGTKIYIYGKSPTKNDRKMGHINVTAPTVKEAIRKARKVRKIISI